MSAISKLIRRYEKEYKAGNFENYTKIGKQLERYNIEAVYAIDLIYFMDSNINVLYSFQL